MLLPDYDTGLRSASLIPNAKWRKRGLVAVFFGGSAVWTAWAGPRPFAPTGRPKPVGSKFGKVTGFGTTYGTGTTDRLDGGVLPRPASGWRSIVSHYYANGTGGGGLGRIFQDVSGTGLQAGEAWWINLGMSYGLHASSQAGAWYTANISTGRWQSAGVTHDQRTVNVTPVMYLDGSITTVTNTSSASGIYDTTPCNMVWGNRASDGARGWDGILGPTFIFDNADGLTADEHATLDKDPLQVFTPDEIEIWVPFGAAGGTTVAPGSGHLTISGKQPTVSQTDHHTVSPGAGHLALSGKQPTVTQSDHHTIAAGVGHLTISGKQPTVTRTDNQTISPGAGHLALSGKQPTVSQTAGTTVSPGAGHLTISGKQPTVTRTDNQTVSPGSGHITASGKQPTVTQTGPIIVAPSTGHLTFSGHQPTITQIFGGDVPNTPQDTWDRDLQALFEPFYGDFGESAVVAGIPVVGMFSSRAQDSFGIVQPSAAVLRMSATHVAAVGDTVTVGARTYQIAAIHDLDGSGTEKTLELK